MSSKAGELQGMYLFVCLLVRPLHSCSSAILISDFSRRRSGFDISNSYRVLLVSLICIHEDAARFRGTEHSAFAAHLVW
jgi:hypothetical protein